MVVERYKDNVVTTLMEYAQDIPKIRGRIINTCLPPQALIESYHTHTHCMINCQH
jgi:hypothetical protein